MKNEIKDQSGKVLFTAEPSGNKLTFTTGKAKRFAA